MKQKYLFLTGILGLALVFGVVSTSCDNGSGGETTKVTVTFNRNGATGAPPADKTVDKGARITIPDEGNLTLAGSTFDCWNTSRDGSGTSYYDGDSMRVDDDITLYAQWRQNIQGGGTFTVSTNNNTSNDVATLGLVGTTANSSNTSVATAAITDGKIAITSVSAGTATITVRNASGNEAQIPVTVNANGTITIGTITKYNPNPSPGGNEIQGGITVQPISTGIRILLDMTKVPSGTTGIQYYIKGPNYNKPVQIWIDYASYPNSPLDYPFTESGSTYTVETQYTMPGGNEPRAATVSVTATGGSGDIMLRNNPSVMYRSSNETVEITPAPDFREPSGWACTYGLVLYLASDNRSVYITHFPKNTDTTALDIRQFRNGTSWDGNRPLSLYDNRDVFIEAGYHFATGDGTSFKIVIGNTSTFKFPYFP